MLLIPFQVILFHRYVLLMQILQRCIDVRSPHEMRDEGHPVHMDFLVCDLVQIVQQPDVENRGVHNLQRHV